jgi:hypothetical protein
LAQRWQDAWLLGVWQCLRDHQRRRRGRSLGERLRGLLLSWPFRHPEWPLPYTDAAVTTWLACERREGRGGDGRYLEREEDLREVLVKTIQPALTALRRRGTPRTLDAVATVTQEATRYRIRSRTHVERICSIVERGRDAAWRDHQTVRSFNQLRSDSKLYARFDRWMAEAPWVFEHRNRLPLSPGLVAALRKATRPRSWRPVRLPRAGYRGRPRPGGERRPWEQAVSRELRRLGLSRADTEIVRRCCNLMDRSGRMPVPP